MKREFDQAKKSDPQLDMRTFLKENGIEPGYNPIGKDNPAKVKTDLVMTEVLEMKIDVPAFKPTGDVNVLALLIDFHDNEGKVSADHYNDILFSEWSYLNGRMRDYYQQLSYGKVICKVLFDLMLGLIFYSSTSFSSLLEGFYPLEHWWARFQKQQTLTTRRRPRSLSFSQKLQHDQTRL
jgi:hypothetical protein